MLDQYVQAKLAAAAQGIGVDIDHEFGDQCWDLTEEFAEYMGVPREPWAIPLGPNGWALEAWTDFENNPHMVKYFDRIPAGQQQPGDIVIYNGHGIYVEGHIAIYLGNGIVLEQNADPDGSLPHTYKRPDTYLLGALRIKEEVMAEALTLEGARILAYSILGRSDALNGNQDDDLNKNHVGNDALQEIVRMYQSPEAKAFIAKRAQWEAGNTGGTVLSPGTYQVK